MQRIGWPEVRRPGKKCQNNFTIGVNESDWRGITRTHRISVEATTLSASAGGSPVCISSVRRGNWHHELLPLDDGNNVNDDYCHKMLAQIL